MFLLIYIIILRTPKRSDMIYKRNCPNCGDEIQYINPRSFKWADRDKKPCRKCYTLKISETLKQKIKNGEFIPHVRNSELEKNLIRPFSKKCPNCQNEMRYTSKWKRDHSEKNKTLCNSCSTYKYKKNFKNIINSEHVKQMRATKAGYESFAEYEREYPKKKMYKNEVWRLTYKQPLESLENFHLRGKCGVEGAWQIDHIKSIDWGYRNGVAAEEIARFSNLRMIPWKENLLKSSK